MVIPREFTINGKLWKVRYRKRLRLHGHDCNGVADTATRTIYISSLLKKKELPFVFWHEYCHALLNETSITNNNTGGISEIIEEVICDSFANAMTDVDKIIRFRKKKKIAGM